MNCYQALRKKGGINIKESPEPEGMRFSEVTNFHEIEKNRNSVEKYITINTGYQ